MKEFQEKLIVGIDHGYGNIKTANHCFKTGIMGYDTEPLFTKDMLEYDGRYYLVGEGHKEFLPDKIKDEDYHELPAERSQMSRHRHDPRPRHLADQPGRFLFHEV